MRRLAGWLAGLLAAAFAFAALVQGVILFQLARLPFNAEGRYFDDGVVHHAQTLPFHGWLVVLLVVLAVLSARISRRWLRRSRTANGPAGSSALEGIARGEKAIAGDRVATQGEASKRLGRWLE